MWYLKAVHSYKAVLKCCKLYAHVIIINGGEAEQKKLFDHTFQHSAALDWRNQWAPLPNACLFGIHRHNVYLNAQHVP